MALVLDPSGLLAEREQRQVVRVNVLRHRPPPAVGAAGRATGGCGS